MQDQTEPHPVRSYLAQQPVRSNLAHGYAGMWVCLILHALYDVICQWTGMFMRSIRLLLDGLTIVTYNMNRTTRSCAKYDHTGVGAIFQHTGYFSFMTCQPDLFMFDLACNM